MVRIDADCAYSKARVWVVQEGRVCSFSVIMGDVVLEWDQCGLWICRVMSWGWPMLRLIYLGVSENQFRWIVTGKVSGGFSGEAIG